MFVVAVVRLASSVEEEAPVLAAELGKTAYEVGLVLRGGMPAIAVRTDDRARALTILQNLRARGHEAVACDESAVVASDAMTQVRSFRFDPDALVAIGPHGVEERFVFADALAFIRATHASRSETVEKTRERKMSLGRAALSGGLINTKTVTKERVVMTEDRDFALYMFRRPGAGGSDGAPWLVLATRARYEGLGPDLQRSQIENFDVLLRRLRESAPQAVFDERLHTRRVDPESPVDLLAHLLALSTARHKRESE